MRSKLSEEERKFRKKQQAKDYYDKNKERVNKKNREYAINHKEEISIYLKDYSKEYRSINKEKIVEYASYYNKIYYKRDNRSEYRKKRWRKKYYEDPIYRLTYCIRGLISHSIRKMGFAKKSRTEEILGCSFEEFRIYISSKFTEGMSLSNHGKWHIDHIKPISLAKTENDVILLNHYTNLQPLWAEDNLKKGNTYDGI